MGEIVVRKDEKEYRPLSLHELKKHIDCIQNYRKSLLQKGVDYDMIPGCTKPTLLLPGAELLRQAFNISVKLVSLTMQELGNGHREYTARYAAIYKGETIFEYERSCSTLESKYRYRFANPICPVCKQRAIRFENPPKQGCYCWKKLGGCGTSWSVVPPEIASQPAGRIENPDIADVYSTVQAMAQKRAFIGVIRMATGASREFTQDIEDLSPEERMRIIAAEIVEEEKKEPPPPPQPPQKKEEKKPVEEKKQIEVEDKKAFIMARIKKAIKVFQEQRGMDEKALKKAVGLDENEEWKPEDLPKLEELWWKGEEDGNL